MQPVTATSYIAPWPKGMEPTNSQLILRRVWDLFSFIIFPIGLARLGYYGLQNLSGRVIHPAASSCPSDLDNHRKFLESIGGKENWLRTPDGELLNTMLFRALDTPKKGAIVCLFGNCTYYERAGYHFLQFVRNHVGDDVDVLLVNPRGCGKSTGQPSPEGLSMDAFTGGAFLVHKMGNQPDRVLTVGHSLGGYAAVTGAALLQKHFPNAKISALTDRSFTCLTDVALKLYGVIAAWAIWLLNWELDARQAWEQLKGHRIVVHDKKDPLPCHFHDYVQGNKGKNVYEVELRTPPGQDAHNRGYQDREAQRVGARIRAVLSGG